ncbi:hypothetical protein M9Y10_011523 [Tritrichomonas musculus]|uniref:Uncharacterized protein n=1 Tax=Tritrichomonas musculus TaxID=1915356 RepID=A0ABR2IKZ2_9EUKA
MDDVSTTEYISNSDLNDVDDQLHFQLITEENERLKIEIQNLRIQFDQAINIRKDLDQLHSENLELLTKLRATESAKEELERRIQLNLNSYHDQLEKAKNEASMKLNNAQQEINNLQEQLSQIKKEPIVNSNENDNKIQEILFKVDAETKRCQALQEKLNQIIERCSSFFQITFPSTDSIISYLSTTTLNLQTQNNPSSNNDEIQYSLSIKKLSNKLQKEQMKRRAIQNELSEKISQFQLAQSSYDTQLNTAKREINELKGKIQRDELFHQKVVGQLEESLKKARDELLSKKYESSLLDSFIHQNISNNQKQSQSFQSDQNNDSKLNEYKKMRKQSLCCIKRLKDRLSNVQKQLSQSELNNNIITEELTKLKESYSELQRSFESQKNQLDIQLKQNEFLENERKAIQNELVKITTQTENEENKRISELQKKLNEFDNSNENLKKENLSLRDQIRQIKSQNANLQTELTSNKNDLKQTEITIQEIKSENRELKSKLSSIPKPLIIDDILPRSCFMCPNAPLPLTQSLNELCSQEQISPASKISMALSLFQSYYSKQIESMKKVIHDMTNDSNHSKQLKSTIDSFILQISKIDKIHDDVDELTNVLSQFHQNYEKLENEKRVNDQILREFGHKLKIPEDQISIQSILTTANQFIKLQECFMSKNDQLKNVRKQKKMMNDKMNTEIELLRKQLYESQSFKKEMESEIIEKTEKIHQLEITNHENSFKLKELEENIESLKKNHENDILQLKTQTSNEFEASRSSFIKDIEEKDSQIMKMKKKIDSYEQSRALHKKAICILKKKLKQSLDLISENKKKNLEEKEKLMKKIEDEKSYIQKVNNDTVQKLRDQCSELRLSLTKLNELLKDSEDKCSKYHKELSALKRQKQKLEERLNSQQESIERERKIMDSQLHSALLNADMKANNQMINVKSQIEAEKQKIFAYFAEEFRSFFDPNEQIDVNTYQSIVRRAKNELNRLQSSDNAIRRLTNATTFQSTEEAVTQFMMQHRQQF